MNAKHYFLLVIVLGVVTAVMLLPAIPQDAQYHVFADQRTIMGVPNFFNVMSNIPYLVIGLIGLGLLLKESAVVLVPHLKHVYVMFYVGIALVCVGSGYYHLNPSNATLVWDRLPMAISFMAFFSVIFAEYVHAGMARKLFWPLLLMGLLSVVYWYWTESLGQGDLRLYILVQFLPVLLIPIILLLFNSRFSHGSYYGMIIGCYVVAKILELTDEAVFDALGVISGHSLKHLVSSLAPFIFYLALKRRRLVAP